MGRSKVYVIVNAEELAEDAGNRLLKTLEEPAPFVVFLLTAVERGGVLPTIASRCQEIRLRPSPRAELAEALVASGTDPERAQQLAALAGRPPGLGRVRGAGRSAVRTTADVRSPACRGIGRVTARPTLTGTRPFRALGEPTRDRARNAARLAELVARRAARSAWPGTPHRAPRARRADRAHGGGQTGRPRWPPARRCSHSSRRLPTLTPTSMRVWCWTCSCCVCRAPVWHRPCA